MWWHRAIQNKINAVNWKQQIGSQWLSTHIRNLFFCCFDGVPFIDEDTKKSPYIVLAYNSHQNKYQMHLNYVHLNTRASKTFNAEPSMWVGRQKLCKSKNIRRTKFKYNIRTRRQQNISKLCKNPTVNEWISILIPSVWPIELVFGVASEKKGQKWPLFDFISKESDKYCKQARTA